MNQIKTEPYYTRKESIWNVKNERYFMQIESICYWDDYYLFFFSCLAASISMKYICADILTG